jgi:hypothetical protein
MSTNKTSDRSCSSGCAAAYVSELGIPESALESLVEHLVAQQRQMHLSLSGPIDLLYEPTIGNFLSNGIDVFRDLSAWLGFLSGRKCADWS